MDDADRRRREFIQARHPDRGGDPDEFIAGLRAFDAASRQDRQSPARVIVVRRRRWPVRLVAAVVHRAGKGRTPPRVR